MARTLRAMKGASQNGNPILIRAALSPMAESNLPDIPVKSIVPGFTDLIIGRNRLEP